MDLNPWRSQGLFILGSFRAIVKKSLMYKLLHKDPKLKFHPNRLQAINAIRSFWEKISIFNANFSNSQREGYPEPSAHKSSYFKSGLAIASSAKPNGAKFWPNGSANKACVAGVRLGKIFHFRRPFLWFICLRRTRRINFINIF